jgi:hypothetical protein
MPSAANHDWSFAGTLATQGHGDSASRIDVAHPDQGIRFGSGQNATDTLLGVDLAALSDHWLRGADVVAIYEPSDRRRLRSTVMWRARKPAEDISAWEVVVSAQTSLLEVDVALAVWSEFAADDLLWSDARPQPTWHALGGSGLPATATAVLARRRGSTSAVIAVHPADARHIEFVRQGNRSRVGCWLFSSALEKGVLLRSRVLAAIGPGVADEAWATRLLADFAASPPPLTA